VAVTLTHDGREVFSTTGQGDLQAAVLSVYGREVASSMIPVEAGGDELPRDPWNRSPASSPTPKRTARVGTTSRRTSTAGR